MRNITQADVKLAKAFRRIWAVKKDELDLTQVKAAKSLGISQAAFSQFLHCTVALNTDMVLKIADLLQVSPEELDPALGPALRVVENAPKDHQVPVLLSISGKLSGDTFVTVNMTPRKLNGVYAVHIDTDDYAEVSIYRDCYLIVSPTASIRKGTPILVNFADGTRIMALFESASAKQLTVSHKITGKRGQIETLPGDKVFTYHKITSIQF